MDSEIQTIRSCAGNSSEETTNWIETNPLASRKLHHFYLVNLNFGLHWQSIDLLQVYQ